MQAPVYPDHMKVKDALQIYFNRYHFADGGYNDPYFKIKLGPLFIPVPNTASRIKAVKLHDIHHLLTGYTAFWEGEVEIGAWEIASGCQRFFVAWLLNFGSFAVGLLLYPKKLFRAFMLGRQSSSNLYYGTVYNETLLESTLGELRKKFGMDRKKQNEPLDYFYFSASVLLVITPVLLLTGLIFYQLS
jgi:hypothetical protein